MSSVIIIIYFEEKGACNSFGIQRLYYICAPESAHYIPFSIISIQWPFLMLVWLDCSQCNHGNDAWLNQCRECRDTDANT